MSKVYGSSFPKDLIANGAHGFLPTNLDAFIATRAFPTRNVSKTVGSYIKWQREAMQRIQGHGFRSPVGVAEQIEFGFSTATFETQARSFRSLISADEKSNSAGVYDPKAVHNQTVMTMVLRAVEDYWASTYFTTSFWTDQSAPSDKWDTDASDPIKDVTDAVLTIESVLDGMADGLVGICGKDVARRLQNHPAFKDFAGVRLSTAPAPLSKVAEALGLDEILVSSAVKVTSKEGATSATSDIVGDGFLVLKRGDVFNGANPTAGVTFVKDPLRPRSYRSEDLEPGAEWCEASLKLDFVAPATELGVFIADVLT